MIFFSHSGRIRILQLTFALVYSCSEGLLTTASPYKPLLSTPCPPPPPPAELHKCENKLLCLPYRWMKGIRGLVYWTNHKEETVNQIFNPYD